MANVTPAANPYAGPKAAVADGADEVQPVRVFSTSGRIGRARYIAYGVGFWLLAGGINGAAATMGGIGGAITVAVFIALVAIGFMLTIQRCHDFNTSGWLSILGLVPLVNLMFWFIPGTDGPNRFGAPTPPNSVGVMIGVFVIPLIAVAGILAAVAIPAYQDYSHRARVSEALVAVAPWREAVTQHFAETRTLPANTAELRKEIVPASAGGRYGRVLLGSNGMLTLTMSGQSIEGKTIVLQPAVTGNSLQWSCSAGTLERKYRPASCRQ